MTQIEREVVEYKKALTVFSWYSQKIDRHRISNMMILNSISGRVNILLKRIRKQITSVPAGEYRISRWFSVGSRISKSDLVMIQNCLFDVIGKCEMTNADMTLYFTKHTDGRIRRTFVSSSLIIHQQVVEDVSELSRRSVIEMAAIIIRLNAIRI